MRDTIIMLAAATAIMLIMGYISFVNAETCVDQWNSEELCNRTFNR
jgi:nitrate/TMAO reductase-like tetraheme cytochrome c subunit